MGRGGKRDGAGRKPNPSGERKLPITVRVDPEILEYLRSQENATLTIETAIKRSAAFREHRKETNG